MQYRSSQELRELFLSYFEGHGCRRFPSFSLVPDDPTLLFTVAGMVPFKPYFLGIKTPEVTRATTAQKCVRTNDIDNVGYTARHHTFFEMLGNFSFGDYFKKEIIPWAWEFLTERIGLDASRMYATIYLDDDEAHAIWKNSVGVSDDHIYRFGDDDNFWAAGPTGPCGPCSELLYDQGPAFGCDSPDCKPGCNCDRYLEIWNLVFMQFNRDEAGILTPLPKQNIDTGMGLERLSSVVQQVRGDFETDLFKPIIQEVENIAGVRYEVAGKQGLAMRVISDHMRAAAFMIADGILPANEGQGYVLRRLIRRAARYGRTIGITDPFLLKLLPVVTKIMVDPYVELREQAETIKQVMGMEETRFNRTLEQGSDLLEAELKGREVLSGDVAFTLYDTYGFPLELTREICADAGVTVDEAGFEAAMNEQRERARASSRQSSAKMGKNVYTELLDQKGETVFTGYICDADEGTVIGIVSDEQALDHAGEGQRVDVVLDKTPFYGEKGGQIGDTGTLSTERCHAVVLDTQYPTNGLIVHQCEIKKGTLCVGDRVLATVDADRRRAIRINHTATHLLHQALINVLGSHVRQAGSLVAPHFLRFDFNHFGPLTREQIMKVEKIVYEQILANKPVCVEERSFAEARSSGAKALFEEKYGDVVRVLTVPDYSSELCGGLHVSATGSIGLVKIVRDEGIGSGVRRINAIAGRDALKMFQMLTAMVADINNQLGGDLETLSSRVEDLLDDRKSLERKTQELTLKVALASLTEKIRKDAENVPGDKPVLVAGQFEGAGVDILRQVGDHIKQARPNAVALLGSAVDGKVVLVAMAGEKALACGAHAGNLVKEVSRIVDGSGGGKPQMAQAGGKDPSKLQEALDAAQAIFDAQIAGGSPKKS